MNPAGWCDDGEAAVVALEAVVGVEQQPESADVDERGRSEVDPHVALG
jgi:hypothetical protein